MSYKANHIYPCNPATARGTSTKLSAHKDKIVYTNGRTVIVSEVRRARHTKQLILCPVPSRFEI